MDEMIFQLKIKKYQELEKEIMAYFPTYEEDWEQYPLAFALDVVWYIEGETLTTIEDGEESELEIMCRHRKEGKPQAIYVGADYTLIEIEVVTRFDGNKYRMILKNKLKSKFQNKTMENTKQNPNKQEQAYKEILDVLNKHKDICVYDVEDMESLARNHLFGIELKEKYGFNLEPRNIRSLDYNRLGEYICLTLWGKKHSREISWSDDGKQPEDELLLQVYFPTGEYIFGNDHPTLIFNEFWEELKTYNPKYADTTNKALYFAMTNASKIFNEFPGILKKYNELNKTDSVRRKIEKLNKELAELNNNH